VLNYIYCTLFTQRRSWKRLLYYDPISGFETGTTESLGSILFKALEKFLYPTCSVQVRVFACIYRVTTFICTATLIWKHALYYGRSSDKCPLPYVPQTRNKRPALYWTSHPYLLSSFYSQTHKIVDDGRNKLYLPRLGFKTGTTIHQSLAVRRDLFKSKE